ncbi:MAG: DUF58 domain-containing protein [Bifidobacteriaceae bacterium]|jgi:uncharacterized protein (DUF58 family)|nr:DUF58 domain-containing protein [Bifidobacteriaceae bacterium]
MTASKKSAFRRSFSLPLIRRAFLSIAGRHPSIFRGSGLDFDELREYIPGDIISSIDWKSSARRGSLIVKSFQSNTITDSVILVDSSRLMFSEADNGEKLKDIANFAASLVGFLSVDRGDKTTILYSDKNRLIHEKSQTNEFALQYPIDRLYKSTDPISPSPDITKSLNYILQFWPKRMNLTIIASLPALGFMDKKTLAKIAKRYDTLIIGLKGRNPYKHSDKMQEYDIVTHRKIPAFMKSRTVQRKYNTFINQQSEDISQFLKSKGSFYLEAQSVSSLIYSLVKYLSKRKLSK